MDDPSKCEGERRKALKEFMSDQSALAWVAAHIRSEFPTLACGAVVSDGLSGQLRALAYPNRSDLPQERFKASVDDVHDLELRAREMQGELLGWFFSRAPGNPAAIGQYTQDHAWPWYCYWVISMNSVGEALDYRAFIWEEGRRTAPIALRIRIAVCWICSKLSDNSLASPS